jgi:hypothetical protein
MLIAGADHQHQRACLSTLVDAVVNVVPEMTGVSLVVRRCIGE